MRYTDTHIFFYGSGDIYSNFHNCHFIMDGHKFLNSEQGFMYEKAKFFKDMDAMELIKKTPAPSEVKKLGRLIKNYNDDEWSKVRFDAMAKVNRQKFSQNYYYNQTLKLTKDKILVEASATDKIWGIGLGIDSDLIFNPSNWTGQNLLGKALMTVRNLID